MKHVVVWAPYVALGLLVAYVFFYLASINRQIQDNSKHIIGTEKREQMIRDHEQMLEDHRAIMDALKVNPGGIK